MSAWAIRNSLESGAVCAVLVAAACDFSGDRLLGTVADVPQSSAAGGAKPRLATSVGGSTAGGALQLAIGAGGAIDTTMSLPPLGNCNPETQSNDCNDDEYCALASDCRTVSETRAGTCKARPSECPLANGYESVCGCDRKIYESGCLAELQGVSLAELSVCNEACASNEDCIIFGSACAGTHGGALEGAICVGGFCHCGGMSQLL